MNESYINYAKKLNDLGYKIAEIGNKFISSAENKNVETIIESYSIGASKYKECADILADIKPPKIVENEHRLMINELMLFADATASIAETLDVENIDKNKPIIESKLRLHKQVNENIAELTTKIGEKLLTHTS